jgi:hypothetical protein
MKYNEEESLKIVRKEKFVTVDMSKAISVLVFSPYCSHSPTLMIMQCSTCIMVVRDPCMIFTFTLLTCITIENSFCSYKTSQSQICVFVSDVWLILSSCNTRLYSAVESKH